jgi:hypothetical protein
MSNDKGGAKRLKSIVGLVGAVIGAGRAVTDLRKAKGTGDKLAFGNAIANILVVITGAALAIREIRKSGEAGEVE